jgi:hypothetical protein
MSDQPESLDAILAQMRRLAKEGLAANPGFFADRIEAAADRMVAEYCAIIHEKDEAYDRLLLERDKAIKARATGNAALRAALVEISQMCGVGPNEVSAIQIAYICDKALRTKGE